MNIAKTFKTSNMSFQPTHKGKVIFPDLFDIHDSEQMDMNLYEGFEVEAAIFKNPSADNHIFLCDLPTWEGGWGGTFRCFLYSDVPKILGHYTYLKEANLGKEQVEGTAKWTDQSFSAKALVLSEGKPKWGLYMEFEKLK